MTSTRVVVPPHPFGATLARSLLHGVVDLHFGPAQDGDLLPRPEGRSWVRSGVPLMVGTTADEFEETRAVAGTDEGGDSAVGELLDQLPSPPGLAHPVRATKDPVGRLMTDHMFRRPAVDIAMARYEAGHAHTWLYDFKELSPVTGTAAHCHDLPYVWDLLNAEGVHAALGPTPSAELATDLHRSWVTFIGRSEPGWQPSGSGALARGIGGIGDPIAALDVPIGPSLGNPFNAAESTTH